MVNFGSHTWHDSQNVCGAWSDKPLVKIPRVQQQNNGHHCDIIAADRYNGLREGQ